ncbi:hypothetical protein [Brevibacterium antiquum]|uniref:Uncharacterized protein n=1 Tax=Brevibacterium antiquum TaxID=234835 RepID=A0A2H1KT76_9MICO|nr:hypothetical protein [Brevibacterium antiquum]SMY02985.1 hypothetical protein BANT10_03466 [Brevibacterium antiquum]
MYSSAFGGKFPAIDESYDSHPTDPEYIRSLLGTHELGGRKDDDTGA